MDKGNLLLGGAVLALVALNSTKANASTPPINTVPVLTKEQLLQNYNSAIRNVFDNYNQRAGGGFNLDLLPKYSQKIIDAGLDKKTNPKLFSALLDDYPDLKIPETSLTAKQIIRNLELKLYNLYAV